MQTYESRLASSGQLLGDARSAVPPVGQRGPGADDELRVARDAVDRREWLSADHAGGSAVPVDAIRSTGSPLSTLDSSGMGFLTPMVSFLEEPPGQLRGDLSGGRVRRWQRLSPTSPS